MSLAMAPVAGSGLELTEPNLLAKEVLMRQPKWTVTENCLRFAIPPTPLGDWWLGGFVAGVLGRGMAGWPGCC